MKAIAVQPGETNRWHDALSWHFRSFCADGSTYERDLWADVEHKRRQLWLLEDDKGVCFAMLTSVTEDRFKTCEVTHGAGRDLKNWQHLWPAIEHWAREIGCKRIRATARPGWERILPLKKTHVILEGFL